MLAWPAFGGRKRNHDEGFTFKKFPAKKDFRKKLVFYGTKWLLDPPGVQKNVKGAVLSAKSRFSFFLRAFKRIPQKLKKKVLPGRSK